MITEILVLDSADAAARLVTAVVAGSLLGLNRKLHHKAAGMRTHALVSLGASLVMAVSASVAGQDPGAALRTVQGVITGIGFIGAGVILHPRRNGEVRGLTTAASVWVAAGLGIACGVGAWRLALLAIVLAMAILTLGGPVERLMTRTLQRFYPPPPPRDRRPADQSTDAPRGPA